MKIIIDFLKRQAYNVGKESISIYKGGINNSGYRLGLKQELHKFFYRGDFVVETFVSSKGVVITVNIPDRTEEEQKTIDREFQQNAAAFYRKLLTEGKADFLNRSV